MTFASEKRVLVWPAGEPISGEWRSGHATDLAVVPCQGFWYLQLCR